MSSVAATDAPPAASPQQLLAQCAAKRSAYGERELDFLRSIHGLVQVHAPLTGKQLEWLEALATREVIDFPALNRRALAVLQALCRRWLPDGKLLGKEWVARNPTRVDGSPGSFRINVHTGKWADFANETARGGDPISLAAYLFHSKDQVAAALDLKRMLGA